MCESMRAGRQHVADELREAVERKLVADATVIHGPADGVPMFTDTGAHSFPEAGAEMFTDTAPLPDPALH